MKNVLSFFRKWKKKIIPEYSNMEKLLATLPICWNESALVTDFEAETLPLLFTNYADFQQYYAALMEIHPRKKRPLSKIQQFNEAARIARETNNSVECATQLLAACEMRHEFFSDDDYQVVAADVHCIHACICLATIELGLEANDAAHSLLRTAATKIQSVGSYAKQATLPPPPPGIGWDGAPIQLGNPRQRPLSAFSWASMTLNRASFLLHHTYTNYWARLGKWNAALQHATKAITHLVACIKAGPLPKVRRPVEVPVPASVATETHSEASAADAKFVIPAPPLLKTQNVAHNPDMTLLTDDSTLRLLLMYLIVRRAGCLAKAHLVDEDASVYVRETLQRLQVIDIQTTELRGDSFSFEVPSMSPPIHPWEKADDDESESGTGNSGKNSVEELPSGSQSPWVTLACGPTVFTMSLRSSVQGFDCGWSSLSGIALFLGSSASAHALMLQRKWTQAESFLEGCLAMQDSFSRASQEQKVWKNNVERSLSACQAASSHDLRNQFATPTSSTRVGSVLRSAKLLREYVKSLSAQKARKVAEKQWREQALAQDDTGDMEYLTKADCDELFTLPPAPEEINTMATRALHTSDGKEVDQRAVAAREWLDMATIFEKQKKLQHQSRYGHVGSVLDLSKSGLSRASTPNPTSMLVGSFTRSGIIPKSPLEIASALQPPKMESTCHCSKNTEAAQLPPSRLKPLPLKVHAPRIQPKKHEKPQVIVPGVYQEPAFGKRTLLKGETIITQTTNHGTLPIMPNIRSRNSPAVFDEDHILEDALLSYVINREQPPSIPEDSGTDELKEDKKHLSPTETEKLPRLPVTNPPKIPLLSTERNRIIQSKFAAHDSTLANEENDVNKINAAEIEKRQKELRAVLATIPASCAAYRSIVQELAKNEGQLRRRREHMARMRLEQNAESIARRAGMQSSWQHDIALQKRSQSRGTPTFLQTQERAAAAFVTFSLVGELLASPSPTPLLAEQS